MTSVAQYMTGRAIAGYPPYDGTGIPLPVGADGYPVIPGGGGSTDIPVAPGDTPGVAHDDPNVVANPTTAWADDEFATFTDGDYTWDGDSWEPYVAAPPPTTLTVVISPKPIPADQNAVATITSSAPLSAAPTTEFTVNEGSTYTPGGTVAVVSDTEWTATFTPDLYPPVDNYFGVRATGDGLTATDITTISAGAVADPNMGWTKAELIQFAEDHDPPIDVPSSGTKAEILAAILAYIQAHPEEN